MSQMGRVIRAVRKLFNDRSEMLVAINRDENLYRAAQRFNEAIDDFECRYRAKKEEEKKSGDAEQVQQIKQHELKVVDVAKVISPQKAQPEITVSTFASELGLPMNLLLEQFARAGVKKHSSDNSVSEQDKSRLLDFLRKVHSAGLIKKEITQALKQTIRTTGQLSSKAKEIFHGGKECSCGGGNKNCTRCDGRGWIDPGATSPYVPTCLPPAPTSTDTYGELKLRLPRKRAKKAATKNIPPSMSPEAKGRVRAAESIARHAKVGRKVDVPVTYKPKKKKVPSQTPAGEAKKSGSINAASAKKQKNKVGRKVAVAKAFVTRPRKGGTKCNNCGQAFSISHGCPTTSRQPTYAIVKPPAPVKQNTREKDETKRPRRTLFQKSVSGTPIGATKLAGATRQDGRRADTTRAKRFNARLKKGR